MNVPSMIENSQGFGIHFIDKLDALLWCREDDFTHLTLLLGYQILREFRPTIIWKMNEDNYHYLQLNVHRGNLARIATGKYQPLTSITKTIATGKYQALTSMTMMIGGQLLLEV